MTFKQFSFAAAILPRSADCGALQRPTVRDVHVRITGLDLQGASLAFDVNIDSPYPFAMHGPKFIYALDIEDRQFLKSEAPVDASLPAHGVGTATLPVRLG